ncbi:MAG: flagellar FliJ family protein [Nibricoccus sp.]
MKKFRFPLRSVATVRNMIELRAREQFSRCVQACVATEKRLVAQRERVAELETIIRSGRLSRFRPADQSTFMAAFKDETSIVTKITAELNSARREMESARQAWLESRRDVRVIENLEQKARAAHQQEMERENQAAMDDRTGAMVARASFNLT